MSDIPFIPREWERLYEANGEDTFPIYARIFSSRTYESIGWSDYFEQFKELEDAGIIEDELPRISDEKYKELKRKWGPQYSIEDLCYLEDLYNGMVATQNINGALQIDQAKKVCKLSWELNSRIDEGADFDKLMASYDKLCKTAGVSHENIKNSSDIDSTGELFHWLEKRGWRNQYFDDVSKDVLDEMMKNFESYNQRLYTNETGIGEEISRRIEQLKSVNKKEEEQDALNFYGTNEEHDLDAYANDGYEQLMHLDEEFKEEV